MPLTENNVATFDSLAAKTEVLQGLIKSTNVNVPIFSNYMKPIQSSGSRVEWFDQALKVTRVSLSSTHTSGSGSFVLTTSGLTNQYVVIPGVTQIMFNAGTARFNVTNWNSATSTATVTLDQGSDATLASGQYVRLIRNTPVGEDWKANNDSIYATSDYNYFSNFSYTVKIANPNKNKQFTHYIDEISFDNQLENNVPEAMKILEFRALKDFRYAGTGGATRNSNTIQGGNGSSAGGILTLGAARSMYTVSAGSAVLTEDILETDMIELRSRGAFSKVTDTQRNTSMSVVKAYVTENTLGYINKNIRLMRAPEAFFGESQKTNGMAGTFASSYYINGVKVEFQVSEGLEDNEIFYVPREDLIEIQVLRMLEEQPSFPGGDNEARMYNCTFSTAVKNPWLLGYRSNLVAA